jgi:hypothetical protein
MTMIVLIFFYVSILVAKYFLFHMFIFEFYKFFGRVPLNWMDSLVVFLFVYGVAVSTQSRIECIATKLRGA